MILMAALVVGLFSMPAQAAEDPYASDPNRLVPFKTSVQEVYTSGSDVWEVWACDVPNWSTALDLNTVVTQLNATIDPYFTWLSQGSYSTAFVAGGTVTSSDIITQQQIESLEEPYATDCESEVAAASGSNPNGVLIIVDIPFPEGYGTVGAVCPEPPFSGCELTYPANGRRAVVGAASVTTIFPAPEPFWNVVAHEIGHTVSWAHSYGGLTTDPNTSATSQYDNPMDIMSAGVGNGDPIGTIAYNRYAAGWISPSDVAIHSSGTGVYSLAPIGGEGLGMLVLPTESEGHFYTVSARRKASYDAKLPTAGVEVYEIEQRREIACFIPPEWPDTWPCFSTLIRVKQTPPVEGFNGTAHVLGIDDEMSLGSFTVRVLSAGTSSFSVRVSERDSGTFIDDDGNLHEPNIEAIAAAGITKGCNPPDNDRFCPSQPVTRAEMAAFLARAMGLDVSSDYQGIFPDVTEGQWYTPYVEALAGAGVTSGYQDGTYRPAELVTRAEMAVFLVRAFSNGTPSPAQGVFADVPTSAWYAPAVEQIYADAITKGCKTNPLSYCPSDRVLRDQMASFLARALGIES